MRKLISRVRKMIGHNDYTLYAIVLCDGFKFFICSDIFKSRKEADDRGKEIERDCRSMYYIKTIRFKYGEDLTKTLDSLR